MVIARSLIVISFLIALWLSLDGWFRQFSSATLFAFGAVLSSGGFLILRWLSERFRLFARARGSRAVTLGQTLRFYGILALVKAHEHILPVLFAIPTAIIDVFFAVTSFYVAARLVAPDGKPRPGFYAWHIVGLGGLAVSVTLAVLTSSERFGLVKDGITSQPMTWFPMSLVPVFIGPMMVIFHLLALTSHRPERTSKK
jgi:hypothetical protein